MAIDETGGEYEAPAIEERVSIRGQLMPVPPIISR